MKSYGGGGAVGNWKIEQPPHDKALSVIDDITIILPDTDILKNLTVLSYPDFGLYVWRSDRFFLSMRCGHIGQNGNGGHAHNDQLAIELNIDGEDWIADPGTYLYTPSPKDRNVYRSVLAHSAPRKGGDEPASLNFGLFRLEDRAKAKLTAPLAPIVCPYCPLVLVKGGSSSPKTWRIATTSIASLSGVPVPCA